MKRTLLILSAILLLTTIACASAEETTQQTDILIAYFTWADNTIVENAEDSIRSALEHYSSVGDSASSVDATSSASLLVPGNTAVMAGYIHEFVGGDLFSIQVEEPYPDNYDDILDRAADELDDEARPALKTHVGNMTQYRVVFLGFPNWWYSCPMAVKSFVEEYDFSGKTVIPFVSHGTGGISGAVRDMQRCLPEDCAVLEPIGVYRQNILSCQTEIEAWIEELKLNADSDPSSLRIQLTIGDRKMEAVLENNSASRSLMMQLPITLRFEDYNGTEKIAYPASALDISDAPNSCDPGPGTLAYYAPWGNVSLFYREFELSSGLVPLGMLEGDISWIETLTGDFDVLIEAI